MADQQRPDDLARLTALVQTQQARLARLERRRRYPRRILPLLLAALLVALVPLVTLAANPFTDLNPGSPHNGNIDLIYNAGITTGCEPGVAYCPNGLVTREEMASFLARTAGLGTNPPVVNAKTAQTATTATNAGNANTVGGLAPNGLMRVARGSGVTFPTTVPMTTTPTTVGGVTLTAPGPGFILVTGVVVVRGLGTNADVEVTLREAGGAQVSTGITAAVGSNANRVILQPTTLSWVFTVPAAGARTYQLQGDLLSGTNADAYDATLTAIFVPFGSTGGATLEAPEPTTTAGGDETQP